MIHTTIASVLRGRPLAATTPTESIKTACGIMCELDVRAVAVVQDEHLIGVLSERDVIQKCICGNQQADVMQVGDAMTPEPVSLNEDDSLADALEVMSTGRFHHVPVLRDGKVSGLLSSDDVPEEYRMLLERFKEIRGY
jgi:CBS domain-containing protein